MIKLLRIDDRLLHGQVAFAWTKNLGIHLIYVLSDVVVNDEITKMTLGIAKPYGTKLSVYAVDEGIEELKKHVNTNYQQREGRPPNRFGHPRDPGGQLRRHQGKARGGVQALHRLGDPDRGGHRDLQADGRNGRGHGDQGGPR